MKSPCSSARVRGPPYACQRRMNVKLGSRRTLDPAALEQPTGICSFFKNLSVLDALGKLETSFPGYLIARVTHS